MVYREMVVQNYVVFYRVDEVGKRVFTYRILHGKRDREQYLEFLAAGKIIPFGG